MITPYSPTLQTPRLTLTLITPDDIAFRHQLFTDWFERDSPDLKKWTVEIIQQFLAKTVANHQKSAPDGPPQASYIVRLKPTLEYPSGQPIGGINYFRRGEGTVPAEIGFAFLKTHQRMGFGVEAIGEMVRHLRSCGVQEIYACTMEANVGCQKTLMAIGFVEGGFVEMQIGIGKWDRLVAFVLPGMGELKGQKLVWVGSTFDFGEKKEEEGVKEVVV